MTVVQCTAGKAQPGGHVAGAATRTAPVLQGVPELALQRSAGLGHR